MSLKLTQEQGENFRVQLDQIQEALDHLLAALETSAGDHKAFRDTDIPEDADERRLHIEAREMYSMNGVALRLAVESVLSARGCLYHNARWSVIKGLIADEDTVTALKEHYDPSGIGELLDELKAEISAAPEITFVDEDGDVTEVIPTQTEPKLNN